MDVLNFFSGMMYFLIMALAFLLLMKRNLFGVYFVAIEYFYIIGLGVFPMALAWGLVEPLASVGSEPSVLTPIHIIFYSIGAFSGLFFSKRAISFRVAGLSAGLNLDPLKSLNAIFLISFLFFALYIFFLGFEQSIMGASFARSGNFDYFDNGNKYAYLTRPMMLGVLLSLYANYFIFSTRSHWRYLFFCVFMGIAIYLVTASRYVLLQLIAVPFVFYFLYLIGRGVVGRVFGVFILSVLSIFAISTLSYGKFIVYQVGSYFLYGTPIDLNVDGNQGAGWGAFSHLYYSIDAGIRQFFSYGFVVYRDVLLSPIGFLPGGVFEALGLESLSYHFVLPEDKFSCVNTFAVTNEVGCYLPPYFTGASAYFIPVVGGFVFGFVRFYIYSVVSHAWSYLDGMGRSEAIPVLLVIFYFIDQVMLFIPSTISLTAFTFIFSVIAVRSGLLMLRRRRQS